EGGEDVFVSLHPGRMEMGVGRLYHRGLEAPPGEGGGRRENAGVGPAASPERKPIEGDERSFLIGSDGHFDLPLAARRLQRSGVGVPVEDSPGNSSQERQKV